MHKDEAYIGMKVQRRYPSKRTATANVEKGVIKEIFRAMLKDKWLVLVDWEDGISRIIALGYLRNRQEEEKETTEMTEEAVTALKGSIKKWEEALTALKGSIKKWESVCNNCY